MIAKDLISYYVPSVSCKDSGERALVIMDENRLGHVALVDKGSYQGLVSDNDIYDLEDTFIPLKKAQPSLIRPFINAYSHIYEIVALACEYKITVVPVLGDNESFLGVITLEDLILALGKVTNAGEPGGVVILGLNVRDYSMAQIAQIVESENAKILSSYVSSQEDSLKIDLTLKINRKDLSSIIAAFDRYQFEIKASYHESEHDEDLQRRFEQFINYLNI